MDLEQSSSLLGRHESEEIGSHVWLADTLDLERRVGTGTLMGLGGEGLFHNRSIPPHYVGVNLEKVIEDLPLIVPVNEANQANLSNAIGFRVFKRLVFVDK